MATFTQIYYHIVFSTKNRERVLLANKREDLFRYTWGILKNKDCHLYRIGGVEDHVHILTSLHPTIALADLVKDIKVATSTWISRENIFPKFGHWQDGYGAFTVSHSDKDAVIEYIKNQVEHHKKVSFKDELREFLNKHGLHSMKNIWSDCAGNLFRPFRAELFVCRRSVGFTHGYSCCSPPANRHPYALIRCWMLDIGRWLFLPFHV